MRIISVIIFLYLIYCTFKKPMFGLCALWFAIWLYPNSLLYGSLPGNIRFDDVLILTVLFASIYHHSSKFHVLLSNRVFHFSVFWWLIIFLSSLSGYLYLGGGSYVSALKYLFKALYVPFTVIAVILNVNTKSDLENILKNILMAGAAAASIGIGTAIYPDIFNFFLIPDVNAGLDAQLDRMLNVDSIFRRAAGSVGIVGTSIITLLCSLLAIYLLVNKYILFSNRIVLVLISFICVTGLFYTQSRGPIMAFFVCLFSIILFAKYRGTTLLFVLSIILLIFFNQNMQDVVLSRFVGEGASGGIDESAGVRAGIWTEFMKNYDFIFGVTGVSMVYTYAIFGMTVHNTYLGTFFYGGVFGVVWFCSFIFFILERNYLLRINSNSNPLVGFSLVSLFSLLLVGISIETFQHILSMQLFMVLLTLVGVSVKLSKTSPYSSR